MKIFPDPPVLSFKRPPNLKDILVRAALPRGTSTHIETVHSKRGCVKCSNRSCRTCCHIEVTSSFTSHVTGRSFEIRQPTSCRSVNAIYLIQCGRCGLQYVGETGNEIRQRMNNQRSTIKNFRRHTDKPVAAHFSSEGHSVIDLRIVVIEQLGNRSKFRRQLKERFWIETLQTDRPLELNIPPN